MKNLASSAFQWGADIIICRMYFSFLLSFVVYVGIWLLNRCDKFKDLFYQGKEYIHFMMIMTFFTMMTYVLSELNNINKISCAIICAVVEIVIIMLSVSKYEKIDSEIMVTISNEQWYVFRRMNEYLICGDAKKLNNSKKIKLIKLDTILEGDLFFEKCE